MMNVFLAKSDITSLKSRLLDFHSKQNLSTFTALLHHDYQLAWHLKLDNLRPLTTRPLSVCVCVCVFVCTQICGQYLKSSTEIE